jgi:hypothetical protein
MSKSTSPYQRIQTVPSREELWETITFDYRLTTIVPVAADWLIAEMNEKTSRKPVA